MNNFNSCIEIDRVNAQLERADIQKSRLICDIYREYEFYLDLVRDLLYISAEKGINQLHIDTSTKNIFLNKNEFLCFIEKRINKLIYSVLPLITVEQLKIKKIEKNINQKINFNSLESYSESKDLQKEKFQFEESFQFEDQLEFKVSEDISNTSEYYQAENYEKFGSLDLDNKHDINYLSNNHIIGNIGLEKKFISSLLELIEEVKFEKTKHYENKNINQMDISPNDHSLENFDLIDNSLENLLLNLSYKINQELFKANLIKKMISQDSFKYLVGKNLMIKHPQPFVINFEFNINHPSPNGDNFPSIIFLNISTVELEFKNLNLSIQRNKINELKNQFQRLIKKERYWRQKEISLNKIR